MEVRTGLFVMFRGGEYGSFDTKLEARIKAMNLIKNDRSGHVARIVRGIAFVANRKLCKGSWLDPVETITVPDCTATQRDLVQ